MKKKKTKNLTWPIGMLTRGTKSREEESRLSESVCPKKKGISMAQHNRWKIKEVWRGF